MSKAPAVDYALQIIELFAKSNKDLGITDISNSLSINKNAVSRIIEAFLENNWIYLCNSASKKYRLTMKPFSLMSASVEKDYMLKIANPIISKVRNETCDSVYLGVRNGNNVLYLLHYDSLKEVRVSGRVGGEYPLHLSAPGKVLLAHGSKSDISDYFAKNPKGQTPKSIKSAEEFELEAERIKTAGYATDNEEFSKGIICIACPIYDSEGEVVASVGISSLTIYDDVDSLISNKYPVLRQAAEEISNKLGFSSGVIK